MILEEVADREAVVFDFLESAGLEIREQEVHDALVMDMYIPELLRGKDADEVGGEVILERLLEMDGHGSGLDADTVDGVHAADLVRKDLGLAGQVVLVAGDGRLAAAGNYMEFETALLQNIPEVLR